MAGGSLSGDVNSGGSTSQQTGRPQSGGASVLTQADIVAAINASKAQDKADVPYGYDYKNDYSVPITAGQPKWVGSADNGRLESNFGSQSMPLYTAYNSGIFATDPRMGQLALTAAGGDLSKVEGVWKAAVSQVAYARQTGKNPDVTVEDLLKKWGKSGVPSSLSGGGGGGGGGPFRQVDRSVSLTDRGTANQIINNALTGYLGREATQVEQQAFLKALNLQEKQNPTVTVREGVSSGSNTTSTTNQTGGFNRDDFAQRFAKSQEGYAEYQTATTYLDAFIDALENPMRAI